MIPERVDESHSAAEVHSPERRRVRRHRRQNRRSWFNELIRPYRRELKSFALLCAVVAVMYLIWNMVAVH